MARKPVNQLHYITHVENLPSILTRGILSHERVEADGLEYEPIYAADIVASRKQITAPNGQSLWSFANLYFQPRNAMLYRVLLGRRVEEIVILGVHRGVLERSDIFISLGNAASSSSAILPADQGRKAIPEIRKWISNEWWTEEIGLKRKMMAECLVPDAVPPDSIQAIFVGNHEAGDKVRAIVTKLGPLPVHPEVVLEPPMFFRSARQAQLTPQLSVADGDMFFSRMQTLTVSVNCVGVMGKGLASRAKYQFPDVYVVYQDVCRTKRMEMGKPFLYRRESSLDYQLADEPLSLSNANTETWFLLFPTKRHWREAGDIAGIEQGLQWLSDTYKREGIKSLAVPALGCGLGRLEWREVGPLMCRYLSQLDIPTRIYLPAEKRVPDDQLSPRFLLGQP